MRKEIVDFECYNLTLKKTKTVGIVIVFAVGDVMFWGTLSFLSYCGGRGLEDAQMTLTFPLSLVL